MELHVKGITKLESDGSIEVNKTTRGITWNIKAYGKSPKEIEGRLKELKTIVTEFVKELPAP